MVEWKEREHEDVDTQAMNDPNFLEAFRACKLPKLFLTLGMRSHPELLQYLISLWEINGEYLSSLIRSWSWKLQIYTSSLDYPEEGN